MNIEIPVEFLMSPWTYIVGYFLISFLVIKPIKWFWKRLEGPFLNRDDRQIIGLFSFFWPIGVSFCILITIFFVFGKIYNYLIGD